MDVRSLPRERVFSILNDNDSPSFAIPQRQTSSLKQNAPVVSPRQERPSLYRSGQYKRTSSFSSTNSYPPLLRFDSTSSRSSNSSMDSSPSPITPAYHFGDMNALGYDSVLRQDLVGYLPSPTTITPFIDSQLMIAPIMSDPFAQKTMLPLQPLTQYPILPAPTHADIAQLPTPAPSSNSATTSVAKPSPVNSTAPLVAGKKNKYPCPYASSHNCSATFTTSGHAARHGKKHTGEKSVQCPVCNKAFTRKDNMKQHERTHKNNPSDETNSRRSKAAITRDAQRTKQLRKEDSDGASLSEPYTSGSSAFKKSPFSEQTSIEPSISEMPLLMPDTSMFADVPPMMPPQQPLPDTFSANSIYPPLIDDSLLAVGNPMLPLDSRLAPLGSGSIPMPPSLVRGFSDLDTLAQVAESFDPSYQQTI